MDTGNRKQGPPIYENWRASLENKESLGAFEVPLFTDAHITGMVAEGYGPYQFLNTVPYPRDSHMVAPAIILRAENYLKYAPPSMTETKEDYYHGGWLADEVAALLSLSLGTRVKPGSVSMEFDPDGDPRGRPIAWRWKEDPVLLRNSYGSIIPQVAGTRSLDYISPMSNLSALNPADVIALIRSARLYQDGLWISESEPNLSWLMLVSAMETAANHWRTAPEPPLERLKAWKSSLAELIIEKCGEEIAKEIAEAIVDVTGATKKFIDFVTNFFPDPPEHRPEEWAQHSWTKGAIKKSLSTIYKYRSRALHSGMPFPAPMCLPPMKRTENTWEEVPLGLASGTREHVWLVRDTPMMLHTFEHIARLSLLKWWKSMTPSDM